MTEETAKSISQVWCSEYTLPIESNPGEGNYTKQHFAKMWYDRLLDSTTFFNIQQGIDDPYSWTIGSGCGYTMGGERSGYSNMSDESILYNASRSLYFYDEGADIGVVNPHMLLADVIPKIEEYSQENPLKKVGVLQTIYPALQANLIVDRVQNCRRPRGPVTITIDDAKEVLYLFKELMESAWTKGWDDATKDVQFVGFFDDISVAGTTARVMKLLAEDSTLLMSISIAVIACFSIAFVVSSDVVESRVLVTLIGVGLVVLGCFAGLGFALLIGTKLNVTMAWTLPFILVGLGVSNVCIIM